jgi:hypothetical protein
MDGIAGFTGGVKEMYWVAELVKVWAGFCT